MNQSMPGANCFGDKEMIEDALTSQKNITGSYNTYANECANPALMSDMMNILNEEHQIQHEIFCTMQQKGWYQVQPAEQQKVDQTKNKFQNMQ